MDTHVWTPMYGHPEGCRYTNKACRRRLKLQPAEAGFVRIGPGFSLIASVCDLFNYC
jgi:hypothetical protein